MSNSDQNKTSWRSKLDELDALPGEVAPAKNIAWNKLHDRLREKKANKKAYWYWAAAVFFIGFAITMVLKNADNKTINSFVRQPAVKPQDQGSNNTIAIQPGISATTKTNAESVKKDLITVQTKLKDRPFSKEIATNKEPAHIPAEMITTDQPIVTIVNSLPVIDSSSTVIVPQKKLRVIHLNEISNPNQSNITETDNTNNGFRRFIRHYNKDVSVGNPAPANSGGHILIKNFNAQN